MTALYQLVAEYRAACDKLADLDLDPATLADTIEGERWPLEVKAGNVAVVALSLRAQADAYKRRAGDLADLGKALNSRADSLEDYLSAQLQGAQVTEVVTPDVKLSFRKSTAVQIEDAQQIPTEFMRIKPAPAPEPDKTALAAALKAGKTIPGARLEHRTTLVIK